MKSSFDAAGIPQQPICSIGADIDAQSSDTQWVDEIKELSYQTAANAITSLADSPEHLAKLGKLIGKVAPPDSLPVRLQPRKQGRASR